MTRIAPPTPGTRCLTAVDEPHNGSPDLRRYPLSTAELRAALDAWRDSTKTADLWAICGSRERCEVALAVVVLAAMKRMEVAA